MRRTNLYGKTFGKEFIYFSIIGNFYEDTNFAPKLSIVNSTTTIPTYNKTLFQALAIRQNNITAFKSSQTAVLGRLYEYRV